MSTRPSTSAYQAASASGASQASLTRLVYSSIAQDLLRAANAVQDKDIEARCAASNHALLLLGHLESWLDDLREPVLATSLKGFYDMLRRGILQSQISSLPEQFRTYAQLVLDTREAWQRKEGALLSSDSRVEYPSGEPVTKISFEV